MKRLIILAALALGACTTLKEGSPSLRLYEARGAYINAKEGAVAYASSPTARSDVVHALNAANKAVIPIFQASECFVQGGAKAVVPGVDCSLFSYTAGSLSSYAIQLRSTANILIVRIAGGVK